MLLVPCLEVDRLINLLPFQSHWMTRYWQVRKCYRLQGLPRLGLAGSTSSLHLWSPSSSWSCRWLSLHTLREAIAKQSKAAKATIAYVATPWSCYIILIRSNGFHFLSGANRLLHPLFLISLFLLQSSFDVIPASHACLGICNWIGRTSTSLVCIV